MIDTQLIRRQFPILDREVHGKPLVYFDNTATSQTPMRVVEEINRMYTRHHANVHRGVHCMSVEATDLVENARRKVCAFINAPSPEEIVFTRGTTEGLNLVAASYCRLLSPGDEIILTEMEHHSNIVPWQLAAQQYGLVIKVVPILADGSLDMEAFRGLFTDRTRLVSVAHASNVLGTVNPVAEIAAYAHARGCVVVVDGAQAVPHFKVDVQAIGADFYAFSGHKMYGPTGVGVLYGRRDLLEKMPPYQGGGEMIGHVSFQGTTFADLPYKFEAGTPDYTAIPALTTAIEFIESLGIENIEQHEQMLYDLALRRLKEEIPGFRLFGEAPGKCPVVSFLVGNAHHYDTGMLLDHLGIAVRTGHHCAQPLMAALGVEGTVRASFAVYNTPEEVDVFVNALKRVAQMLN
ncbi:MAG: aminotransferase class V-fold PLP-dependent enzyme [Muribaculaceae bacterium]